MEGAETFPAFLLLDGSRKIIAREYVAVSRGYQHLEAQGLVAGLEAAVGAESWFQERVNERTVEVTPYALSCLDWLEAPDGQETPDAGDAETGA